MRDCDQQRAIGFGLFDEESDRSLSIFPVDAVVGSSARMIFGRCNNARAMATRWR